METSETATAAAGARGLCGLGLDSVCVHLSVERKIIEAEGARVACNCCCWAVMEVLAMILAEGVAGVA